MLVTGVAWSGGSGALHLGLRHPEVFSLVCAGHGVADYRRVVLRTRSTRLRKAFAGLERLWGRPEWDLRTDTGRSVWEETDLVRLVEAAPPAKDLPLVALTARHYVAWGLWEQWRDFFVAMLDRRRPIIAEFQWYGQRLLPVSATATYPKAVRLKVARDLPLLAFRGPGTGVLEKPKGGMGLFNLHFRWSEPADEADRFAVTLRWTGRGGPVRSDVTLRRLRRFRPPAGATCRWINRDLEKNATLQEGSFTVGEDGLLTVPQVSIGPAGSRLVVTLGGK